MNERGDGNDISSSVSRKRQSSGAESSKEKRFKWPPELHAAFIQVIFDLGMKAASPKVLLELMPETPGLTGEHIKSHLQKYRLMKDKNKEQFVEHFSQNPDEDCMSDGGDADAHISKVFGYSGVPSVGNTHTLPQSNRVGSTPPATVPDDQAEFDPSFQREFLVQQISILHESINVLSATQTHLGEQIERHDKVFIASRNNYTAAKIAEVKKRRHNNTHTHASNTSADAGASATSAASSVNGGTPNISPRRASTQSSRANSPVPPLMHTRVSRDAAGDGLQHSQRQSGNEPSIVDYMQGGSRREMMNIPQPMVQDDFHQDESEDVVVDTSSYSTAAAPFTAGPSSYASAHTLRSVPSFNAGQRFPDEHESPYAYADISTRGPVGSYVMGIDPTGRSETVRQNEHNTGNVPNWRPPTHTRTQPRDIISRQQLHRHTQQLQQQQRLNQHMHTPASVTQRTQSPVVPNPWMPSHQNEGGGMNSTQQEESVLRGLWGESVLNQQGEGMGSNSSSYPCANAQDQRGGMDQHGLRTNQLEGDMRMPIHHADSDGSFYITEPLAAGSSYDVTESLANFERAVDADPLWTFGED